ncbi:MAG: hypothetical protein EBR46_07765, partial [Betaproteobacteria bacterium]|nr:hypothetical protein [Betaproteobacteria bacterium]
HLSFRSVKPAGYPIPVDGPVGALLRAQGRHNMRPAHIHFMVVKPGYKTQFSQVYSHDDPHLDTDVQFAVTQKLIGQYVLHENAPTPDGDEVGAWYSLDFTFTIEPGTSQLPRAPITAKASGPDRARIAAEQAVACPLLEGIDLSGARGVLVLLVASRATFKLQESRNAMNTIKRYAADDAHVIYGAAYDESLGDQMRVTVIATGLNPGKRQQAPLSVVQAVPVVQRTGTDNLPVMAPTDGQVQQAPTEANYSGLGVPSVWRKREASARVEALANNGMDEIEIPAFLRRQAD